MTSVMLVHYSWSTATSMTLASSGTVAASSAYMYTSAAVGTMTVLLAALQHVHATVL